MKLKIKEWNGIQEDSWNSSGQIKMISQKFVPNPFFEGKITPKNPKLLKSKFPPIKISSPNSREIQSKNLSPILSPKINLNGINFSSKISKGKVNKIILKSIERWKSSSNKS